MATIRVLGTGCHNCLELEARLAQAIARSARTDVKVKRVDDEREIRRHMPLDEIPGLLIGGILVSERQVPDVETLLDWVREIPVGETA